MPVTAEALSALLARIGPDPAAFFRECGIKGTPDHRHDCPLARLVAAEFGAPRRVVFADAIDVTVWPAPNICVAAPTPDDLAAFVSDFDQLKYPDLIA